MSELYLGPKVLFIDLEMAPMEIYSWNIYEPSSPGMIKQHTTMLAWAASWLGSDEIFYDDVSKNENRRDDSNITASLYEKIELADILVAHNLKKFDKRRFNTRVIVNNQFPTNPAKEIDTLQIAKKHFKFDSNSLVNLGRELHCETSKYSHAKFPGNALFIECLNGNPEAWEEMRIYNPMDITLLKEVYHKLIPWDSSINFSIYDEGHETKCQCGSFIVHKFGFSYEKSTKRQKYRCKTCGHIWRGGPNLISAIKKEHLLK